MPVEIKVHILDTGACLAPEAMIIRGGRWKFMECPCLVALIRHSTHGWILWDTGYAPRMLAETHRLPYRLYRLFTPLRILPDRSVAAQLPRFGLLPGDVKTVIISHFHADHLAGLRDFPQARIIAAAEASQSVERLSGVRALRKAFIPGLVPEDLGERLEPLGCFDGPELGALGPSHDLYGDGSLRLVRLPGHARGQMGLHVTGCRGPLLFAADGAWLSASIRELRPPHPLTHRILDDPAAAVETLRRLHDFHEAQPEVTIVPTHCPEMRAALVETH